MGTSLNALFMPHLGALRRPSLVFACGVAELVEATAAKAAEEWRVNFELQALGLKTYSYSI